MSLYFSAEGDQIIFETTGEYIVPSGDLMTLGYVDPMLAINFNFTPLYAPPEGDAILLGGEVVAPPDPPQPTGPEQILYGRIVPWGENTPVDEATGAGWSNKRRFLCKGFGVPTGIEKVVDKSLVGGWSVTIGRDVFLHTGWQGLRSICSFIGSGYLALFGKDIRYDSIWDSQRDLQRYSSVGYLVPPVKDITAKILWDDDFRFVDGKSCVSYGGVLPTKDLPHRTMWGRKYYEAICYKKYLPAPPLGINFKLTTPIKLVDDGDHINFSLSKNSYDERCTHREPSGWRDANTYYPPPTLPTGLSLRTYIMMSSAQLNRLPDNLAIPVQSLTLSLDWDSVHWSLSATVIGGDVRDLSPTVDGPIEVEAQINGTTWRCVVDDWSRDISFGKVGRSIRGRSQGAILGEPWARLRTEVQTEARTARQLMDDQLLNTGWTIESTLVDWLVPAGSLSYENASPLQVIKKIAAAAGGFVRPDSAGKVLHVLPKFKKQPWLWVRADADLVLPASMVVQDNGAWDGRTEADVVHIIGGISVSAKREGTAGATAAPEVSDPLVTAVEAGRARAVYELGKCGKWQTHSLSLPVFSAAVPGVILPGQIIAVEDLVAWFGVVTSVSVTASWGSNGLVVRQQVGVEVYCGN